MDGIIRERDELITPIFNYIHGKNLQHDFYKYLLDAEKSWEYRQLDLEFMSLDYMGYENEK